MRCPGRGLPCVLSLPLGLLLCGGSSRAVPRLCAWAFAAAVWVAAVHVAKFLESLTLPCGRFQAVHTVPTCRLLDLGMRAGQLSHRLLHSNL
ncbi:hypothetical protein MTO96_030604 [Rhipicephalus appendiculatus]